MSFKKLKNKATKVIPFLKSSKGKNKANKTNMLLSSTSTSINKLSYNNKGNNNFNTNSIIYRYYSSKGHYST